MYQLGTCLLLARSVCTNMEETSCVHWFLYIIPLFPHAMKLAQLVMQSCLSMLHAAVKSIITATKHDTLCLSPSSGIACIAAPNGAGRGAAVLQFGLQGHVWPTCAVVLLQTNLAESQQSLSAKEDQVQDLNAQLGSAQVSAADLTMRKNETEEQLHQQKALLGQVHGHTSATLATHHRSAFCLSVHNGCKAAQNSSYANSLCCFL